MRLLIDVMCGRLRTYLRICGYDTLYAADRSLEEDDELVTVVEEENRVLVTRDVSLADRLESDQVLLLDSRDHTAQLRELTEVGLDLSVAPEPQFCGRCNGRLERVEDASSFPSYVPAVVGTATSTAVAEPMTESGSNSNTKADEVELESETSPLWQCVDCGQYFWRGSHWDRMRRTLESITSDHESIRG